MPRHDDFDERFDALALLAYQVAHRLTGDRHESEDLAQETMTRAYLKWPRMHGHAEAWVVRVATNLVIGRWRRGRRPHAAPAAAHGSDHGMAERLALTAALRTLPRRQREVAVLRFVGDLTIEQAAAALGCSVGTVKQHSSRAMRALRAHAELRDHVDAVADRDPPGDLRAPRVEPPTPRRSSTSVHAQAPAPRIPRSTTARSTDVP